MTQSPHSPGRLVALSAIKSILNSGYCEEAIAGILQIDASRYYKLSVGRARFREAELKTIEYATGRTAYDWALAGTFEPAESRWAVTDSGTKGMTDQIEGASVTIWNASPDENTEQLTKVLKQPGATVEIR